MNCKNTLIPSIPLLLVIPLIYGTANLDYIKSADCLERMVALIGIPMFTSLFYREQTHDLYSMVALRPFPFRAVAALRIGISIAGTFILVMVFEIYMRNCGSIFPFGAYAVRASVVCMVLGFAGLLCASVAKSTVAGYLGVFCFYFVVQTGLVILCLSLLQMEYIYGTAEQVAELRQAFQRILPHLFFAIFAVSFAASWVYSRLITKPVLEISRISEEMSGLHLEWELDGHRSDELGTLEKSLNSLSHNLSAVLSELQDANKKLEDDIERERKLEQAWTDFFSAVSHELKTPITVIKGQLEGMLLGIGAYKDHGKYLARSLEIANTLESMVQEILTISRLDAAGADFKKDNFDCVQVIRRYLSETEDLVAEKDLQICLDLPATAFINGNKILVEKVFSNLIGNAVKYSPPGAAVQISGQMEFSVENTGTHIPDESIPKLFDAFYRVEQSRSRKTGGLGLYVTQRILHQHGSECKVRNTASGVRFSFAI